MRGMTTQMRVTGLICSRDFLRLTHFGGGGGKQPFTINSLRHGETAVCL